MKKINIKKFFWVLALPTLVSISSCTGNQIKAGIGVFSHAVKGASITNQQLSLQAKRSAIAMDKKHKVASKGSRYSKRLRRLTAGLRNYNGIQYNFKVYISKQINAFAMPDGTVRVHSKLMDIMNDDELLAVIGHEIGHVELKHSLGQYKKAYMVKAAQLGLQAYGSNTVAGLANSYGEIGARFLGAKFSRNDELEADTFGVKVLHHLGKNPYAAASAQKKLRAYGGGRGGFFASHPSSEERIRKATAAADALKK